MGIPLEIIGLQRPQIELVWEDEHHTQYTARDLRLLCRCAHCIDEVTGQKRLDPATVPMDLIIRHIELVGNYAISVTFSDGHSTGIYHFRRLRGECACSTCQAQRTQ